MHPMGGFWNGNREELDSPCLFVAVWSMKDASLHSHSQPNAVCPALLVIEDEGPLWSQGPFLVRNCTSPYCPLGPACRFWGGTGDAQCLAAS